MGTVHLRCNLLNRISCQSHFSCFFYFLFFLFYSQLVLPFPGNFLTFWNLVFCISIIRR